MGNVGRLRLALSHQSAKIGDDGAANTAVSLTSLDRLAEAVRLLAIIVPELKCCDLPD